MAAVTVEYAFWRSQPKLGLSYGVIRTTIADGRPALRTADGHFVALSSGSEQLIELLRAGCSGLELEERIKFPDGERRAQAELRLSAFLDGLGVSGILTVSRIDPDETRLGRFARADFFARVPIWSRADRSFRRCGSIARRVLPPKAVVIAALCAFVFGLSAMPVLTFDLRRFDPLLLFTLPGVIVVQMLLHEVMHGLALGYLRVRVKSAGLGLLLGVIPTAYVDRTGAYAIRNRLARALVSLAGPLSDMLLLGLVGLIIRSSPPDSQGYFEFLGLLLAATVVVNLNPFFPSDGQQALEAGIRGVNTRVRAFTYVGHRLTGSTLPFSLRTTSRRARLGFWLYVIGSLIYLAVAAIGIIRLLISIGTMLWRALGW